MQKIFMIPAEVIVVLVASVLLSCSPEEARPPAGSLAGPSVKSSDSKDTQKRAQTHTSIQQHKVAAPLRDTCMRMAREGITSANAAEKQAAETFSTQLVRVDHSARLHVYVELTALDDSILQTLTPYQLEIEQKNESLRLIQGWIACAQLDGLASVETVRRIRPPDYAVAR